jgi:predicted nuclease of predicted toxin-antitoxin system
MRFIIDANLPKVVARIFAELGHEAILTSQLADGNSTQDGDILILAAQDGVVISKDKDFYHSFLMRGQPNQLVYIRFNNLLFSEVKALFIEVAPKIVDLLGQHDLIEVYEDKIAVII